MDEKTKTFVDIKEAAKMTGYSTQHFRRIITRDKIPTTTIGKKLFVRPVDIIRWQDRRKRA